MIDNDDFTLAHYRELLKYTKENWFFAKYTEIPWGKRFVLWRHDLDFSINRAHKLAVIEHEENVKATYFVNPHSEFYNMAELRQLKILKNILDLGHDIGLHLDAAFYGDFNESDLHDIITKEANYIADLLGVKPLVFSFHNPTKTHLNFNAESYGGLFNCYSNRLMSEVTYCSDSNGYWRHKRLYDVLSKPTDDYLQILTHPGWWQDKPMYPRSRIFRSIYGRAEATLQYYDLSLTQYGRFNQVGRDSNLMVMADVMPEKYKLCDYLWNVGHFETLFIELWCIHMWQINNLCKAAFCNKWGVNAKEINKFYEDSTNDIHARELFKIVFDIDWNSVINLKQDQYLQLDAAYKTLLQGRSSIASRYLEDGCVFLCSAISSLAAWGKAQTLRYDGITHLDTIGITTCKGADGYFTDRLDENENDMHYSQSEKWAEFKMMVEKYSGSGLL